MKRSLLVLCLIAMAHLVFSQGEYDYAYIIDNSGNKFNVQIKIEDWRNNPSSIQYKTSEDGAVIRAEVASIREFARIGGEKYVRQIVGIDKMSNQVDYLDYVKDRPMEEEVLFLKVLQEGEATLYYWSYNNIERFFYSTASRPVEQLIYSRYLVDSESLGGQSTVAVDNDKYKEQVRTHLKCTNISSQQIEDLKYTRYSLMQFFYTYNRCQNSDYRTYEDKSGPKKFRVTIRPRLNLQSAEIDNRKGNSTDEEFKPSLGFAIGVDIQHFLVSSNGDWLLTVEPTYKRYQQSTSKENANITGGIMKTEVNYNSVELPIGLRHNFSENNGSMIFVSVLAMLELNSTDDSIVLSRTDDSIIDSFAVKSRINLGFGLGYEFQDKYSVELRYHSPRKIQDTDKWLAYYNNVSLIAGYQIF